MRDKQIGRNLDGSAKGMEPAMAVHIIKVIH